MSTDVPHTLYLKDNGKGKRSGLYYVNPDPVDAKRKNDEATRWNDELVKRLEAKQKKNQWEKVTIDEVMNEQKQ